MGNTINMGNILGNKSGKYWGNIPREMPVFREIIREIFPGNKSNLGRIGRISWGIGLSIYANFGQNQAICDFWSKSGSPFL